VFRIDKLLYQSTFTLVIILVFNTISQCLCLLPALFHENQNRVSDKLKPRISAAIMLFNSIVFLIFFPIVTLLYFLLPFKMRWGLLLAASCFFYMFFKPEYILILFFTIIVDYYAGIYLEEIKNQKRRQWFLIASIIANVGVLAVFKYYNFINDNISGIAHYFGGVNHIPYLKIILPIGLSFHTFQAMSYTIEVYRGHQKAERHFGYYSLYVMFYPQLVAGPIERPQNLINQLRTKHDFSYENAVQGINLIVFGLFKKMVIADRLSVYVDQVYGDISNASTISMVIACIFFSIQIYADFSGYSDIARGTARFMGIELMLNFNRPYHAQSIGEFWSRWHISLSTWFRDYVYIPLGGNRVAKWKWYRNLIIVFMLSGLWHGANWTFVIWGALHAAYIIFELGTKNIRTKIGDAFNLSGKSLIVTYFNRTVVFIAVTFAWIFFRAKNFDEAMQVINKLGAMDFSVNITQLSAEKGPLNLVTSCLVILMLILSIRLPHNFKLKYNVAFAALIISLIIILGKDDTGAFIYFQF
jgi:alginate O-acetyltransferase complex protein AlgI